MQFIDLFCGIGGFHTALKSFNLECVFASEIDKHAAAIYNKNYNIKPSGDITKINEKEIPPHDFLCAGFPCQAFSISGNQDGFNDARGTLFFEIIRIAKHHKPKVLFLENVKNFASHDNGNTLKIALKKLKSIGYDVFYKILNSAEHGAPTARKRIYFVCFRKDLNVTKNDFKFPEKEDEIPLKFFLQKNIKNQSFAINNNNISFLEASKIKKRIYNPIRIGTIGNGGQGNRIYGINGPAITLSAHGGGIAAKTGAYLIENKVRKLTPRECANIMGFPNSFKFDTNKNQAYKQFGNSVVVGVIKRITEQIIKTLKAKNEY